MKKAEKALLVYFNGRSNAGGAERMVLYLDEYLQSRGLRTEIIDETFLLNTLAGKLYSNISRYRHFSKRKAVYMARFTSMYLWTRIRPRQVIFSNGENTPFFPVDVVTNHGCYHVMEKAYGRKSPKLSRVANLQRLGLLRCRLVTTVTEEVKKQLINEYGIPEEKIQVVTNRVDTDYFYPIPRKPAELRTILYVGRLEPGKGLQAVLDLAEIIEHTENWNLLIASNNGVNADLFSNFHRTEIRIGLQLENINREAYSKADLVFYPSHSESFGMVTLEALACGIPIVGTATGILPDLVGRNFPGAYLLNPLAAGTILQQFEQIIHTFEQNVNRQQLHEKVKQEFGIASFRTRLDEVIGPLLGVR